MHQLAPVRVGNNKRFHVNATGALLFWLADTACEPFHRLTRDETAPYFAALDENVALAAQHELQQTQENT